MFSDNDAQEKLKQFGNRKGISSEELFGNKYEKDNEAKQRYSQLQGAKAISSDMFFGKPVENEKGGSGDNMGN
jgi:hypothetical protein